jgi:hypothetical protein
LCRSYLSTRAADAYEISPEELVSEVWAKLMASTSVPADTNEEIGFPDPSEWTIDLQTPQNDGRVIWLIREIGGPKALAHRCEDIRRRRWGRAIPGVGRPIVQPSESTSEMETGPDEGGLRPADAVNIWRGVLATAERTFQPQDDVRKLLWILSRFPGVLDESQESRWPVRRLAVILSTELPPPSWSDDRVENAKRRLLNWIQRLMRENGLDATELEALFARVARQQVQQQMPAKHASEVSLLS